LIVALVFKGFARKEIEIMAPFYEDVSTLGVECKLIFPLKKTILFHLGFYCHQSVDTSLAGPLISLRHR
jgi:hypothetical protein